MCCIAIKIDFFSRKIRLRILGYENVRKFKVKITHAKKTDFFFGQLTIWTLN